MGIGISKARGHSINESCAFTGYTDDMLPSSVKENILAHSYPCDFVVIKIL